MDRYCIGLRQRRKVSEMNIVDPLSLGAARVTNSKIWVTFREIVQVGSVYIQRYDVSVEDEKKVKPKAKE